MAFRNPKEYGKVAVLMGGTSAEREMSLQSGKAVLAALLSKGVDAYAVDAAHDAIFTLQNGAFNRVFNILHGRGGEDGVIQGALEMIGLSYTGSGVLASALGMNKLRTKEIWKANELPTPEFMHLARKSDIARVVADLGLPVMIKPAREGSSIGVAKANSADDIDRAWRAALEFDDIVLAERFVHGSEYTIGIVGRNALPIIRVETPSGIFDYHAKREANPAHYFCPSGLDVATEQAYKALALKAFEALGAKGWARVDMMADVQGNPWLIEINTLPGMSDQDLIPMAAKAAGIEYDDLVLSILESSTTDQDEGELDGC
jgi:D-alanine-D-alanine ligase